jgi:hypothetical protein
MTQTPEMLIGNVEMVSVEWIMQNSQSSVDGFSDFEGGVDYEFMLRSKTTDSNFGHIIGTIINRGFRVPIVMCPDRRGGGLTHGNGHHRMCAAILLGLDEIPVYWAEDDYMSSHESEKEELGHYQEWDELCVEMDELWFSTT